MGMMCFNRPYGTGLFFDFLHPGNQLPGYYHLSLRDTSTVGQWIQILTHDNFYCLAIIIGPYGTLLWQDSGSKTLLMMFFIAGLLSFVPTGHFYGRTVDPKPYS